MAAMLSRRIGRITAAWVARPVPLAAPSGPAGFGCRRSFAAEPDEAGLEKELFSRPDRAEADAPAGLAGRLAAAEGPGAGRRFTSRLNQTRGGGPAQLDRKKAVEEEVEDRKAEVEARSRRAFREKVEDGDKFSAKWNKTGSQSVRYRFRIEEKGRPDQAGKGASETEQYSDYSGLRFPTLETAENYDYHKDRGIDRVVERAYPIQVPAHRKLDPYLREYIHFLHRLDPARFTTARIAQRYRLREKTVVRVIQEWSTNSYLTRSGLTRLQDKQTTREAVILAKKEAAYARWVGWDQLGDADDPESDDEAIGEYKGWRSTDDWVRRQNVEVEMMSAFPMMEKRNPMPKRVDVDLVVDSREHHKIINWIDPTDKVVF